MVTVHTINDKTYSFDEAIRLMNDDKTRLFLSRGMLFALKQENTAFFLHCLSYNTYKWEAVVFFPQLLDGIWTEVILSEEEN